MAGWSRRACHCCTRWTACPSGRTSSTTRMVVPTPCTWAARLCWCGPTNWSLASSPWVLGLGPTIPTAPPWSRLMTTMDPCRLRMMWRSSASPCPWLLPPRKWTVKPGPSTVARDAWWTSGTTPRSMWTWQRIPNMWPGGKFGLRWYMR